MLIKVRLYTLHMDITVSVFQVTLKESVYATFFASSVCEISSKKN